MQIHLSIDVFYKFVVFCNFNALAKSTVADRSTKLCIRSRSLCAYSLCIFLWIPKCTEQFSTFDERWFNINVMGSGESSRTEAAIRISGKALALCSAVVFIDRFTDTYQFIVGVPERIRFGSFLLHFIYHPTNSCNRLFDFIFYSQV